MPLSRGKDCYAQSTAGAVKLAGCPLTDGNLSTGYAPQPPAYFDLGAPAQLSLLAMYDVSLTAGAITVEGSNDAQSWSLLSAAAGAAYQRVPLAANVRYVRLLLEPGAEFLAGNGEVALF
jgi:hypothetical protein